MHFSISNYTVSTKIYIKRDDFDSEIVIFTFLDVHPTTSYVVYISQLIRFIKASSHNAEFNICNKLFTQKLPVS